MNESTKLITREDGEQFLVIGNPGIGYTTYHISDTTWVGEFKRSWQAVEATKTYEVP